MARKNNSKAIEGTWHQNIYGDKFQIIKYENTTNVFIRFEDGIEKKTFYSQITKGNVIHPNKQKKPTSNFNKTKFGVGYLGEGIYPGSSRGKYKNIYITWSHMLKRCYTDVNRLTYINCSVAEDWHNYQNFAKWYSENYIEGYCLDKDILIKGNKVYSSETCCFVPYEINNLFTKNDKIRGKYPIGVTFRDDLNKFISMIHMDGKNHHLGVFDTIELAFEKYKIAKENYIKLIADKYKDTIKFEVYQAMYNYSVEITD